MSLYLSGWLEGEAVLRSLYGNNWSPGILLIEDDFEPHLINFYIHFLKRDLDIHIEETIPNDFKEEYLIRFEEASKDFMSRVNFDISAHFIELFDKHDENLQGIREELNIRFRDRMDHYRKHVLIDLWEGFLNVLLYGSWVRPVTYKFIIRDLNKL